MSYEELSPSESGRVQRLRRDVAERAGCAPERVRVVRSPYRICPLGAHVDHQLGCVSGMALDRALLLGYVPRRDLRVVVASRQFPEPVRFEVDSLPAAPAGDWADYARGAAFALARGDGLRRGITAIVDGHDDVGGLSSSAAVGVAYLLALGQANECDLSAARIIELDRVVENEFIGLENGILDQSMILLSRPGELTHLDCLTKERRQVALGGGVDLAVAVLFSGLRTPLTTTDYNARVRECREAARCLLGAAGLRAPDPPHLRAVPAEVFAAHAGDLPAPLRRRAEHFFGEQERVARGLGLWREGDLADFGRLVNESCLSSIEKYECGNPYLRTAYWALRERPGVYGARFSGGGFRGCCIGLARPGAEDEIRRQALGAYLAEHPDMEGQAEVYFCRSGPGARLLEG
jgi:galactokinase